MSRSQQVPQEEEDCEYVEDNVYDKPDTQSHHDVIERLRNVPKLSETSLEKVKILVFGIIQKLNTMMPNKYDHRISKII